MKNKHILSKTTLCFALAAISMTCFACGKGDMQNQNQGTIGDDVENAMDRVGDMMEGAGDAAGDMMEGAGDAAKGVSNAAGKMADGIMQETGDVVGGTMNTAEDMLSGYDFSKYSDAKRYLWTKLDEENKTNNYGATFEFRDENQALENYTDSSKGFHFRVFNTAKNKNGELFGDYYVDSTTGEIYKKNGAANSFTLIK